MLRAWVLVVTLVATGLTAPSAAAEQGLLAGADARSIVPDRDGDGTPDLEGINLGGYGLGPQRVFDPGYEPIVTVGPENRPAEDVHDLGIWVRSVAFGNDAGDTVVVQSLDVQGFFIGFKGCDCGTDAIKEIFADRTGLPADNLLVHATHQHAGPNTLGHQGGVPSWYLEQIRDTAAASAVAAVEGLEPATVVSGKVHLPAFNSSRRDTYEGVADDQLVYLHASRADGSGIATLVNYSAHPTVLGSDNRTIYPDYPGALAAELDDRLGGTTAFFNGGVGNTSPRPPSAPDDFARAYAMGEALADAVVTDLSGAPLHVLGDDVRVDVRRITHPVSNPALIGGSFANVYMRSDAYMGPAVGELDYPTSVFPLHVSTNVGGFRIGDAAFIWGPGEIFSSMTIAVKNQVEWASATLVSGLGNDHVGYIMPSYEYKPMVVQEYEELQSLDPYIGDHVLDVMLDVGRSLR